MPTIEPNEEPRNGEIEFNVSLENIQDGDMVLCRNNAPLMKAYNEFIRMGKKCKIRGKDIGLNLKKLVESVHQEKLNANLSDDGVFVRLYDKFFDERDKIIRRTGLDLPTVMNMSIISNKLDMIRALEVLSEDIETSEELVNKIKEMFSDKKTNGISLSTIHKAKGLEANNVYIACRSLMPSKSATQPWEIEQERNLMYVAYTRAKNKLSFIDENIFSSVISNSQESLDAIERQVNTVLNKTRKPIQPNKEIAKILASEIKKIEMPTIGASASLNNVKRTQKPLSLLTQKKLTKIKR